MSIELSLEDVKRVAYHYGFVMEVSVLQKKKKKKKVLGYN